MLKKRYLFLIIVCFFAISAVSAQEIANDTDILADDYDSSLMTESVDENLLSISLIDEEIQGSADNGTFTALQEKINNASEGSIINLKNNYAYDDSFSKDGIIINKSLTINGNGYTLDGKNNARIFSIDADVTLKNINFINGNLSENHGGAINIMWGANTIITNSSFANNSASYGGAIYSYGNLVINDCNFINNFAESSSGAIYTGWGVNSIIANSSFVNNFASFNGGAIGGNVKNITHCSFVNNFASFNGGAIYCSGGSISFLIDSIFVNNSASYGGAIYSNDYDMSNCSFVNNSAKSDGGAIYTEVAEYNIFTNLSLINNTAIRGGAIFSLPSICSIYTINNSNFINNYADNGSSIFISEFAYSGVDAKILDSYFYTNESKELIYSIDFWGYLFLQNNTMVSPNSYKIYITVKPDSISSKKYLILDNETCYINKPFKIAFTDDNGNKIRFDKDIPITFTDLNNDKLSFEKNATFDSDSGFYYISCNQSGLYNLSVDTKFSNNLTIVPAILEVYSLKPDLSINVNNKSYSENTTFMVNVTSEDYPVNKGNISFYIDGKKVGSANVTNGLATFNYAYPHVGTFSILAIYEENKDYLSANMTASFTVNKMSTTLAGESVIYDEQQSKTFKTVLKDNNNYGIQGQNVKIEVIKYSGESATFNGVSNSEGITIYDVGTLAGGMWYVAGNYNGNNEYIESNFTDKFIVIRMDTTTNIEGIDNPQVNHTYKLKANIHDENGKLVKEGIVQFYLDGVDIGSIDLSKNQGHQSGLLGVCEPIFEYKLGEDDSGLYIEYTPSKAGTYTLSAVYEGTTIYKASNETTTLIVKEEDPFKLSALNVTKYYGGSERFVVTLKDKSNNPIANANVKITINGRTSNRTTNASGIASMAINLNSGKYNTTTEYNGTKVYSTVTVKDTVIANDFTKIFKNGTQYYGTFVDSQGNLIKNTDVKININGVFYTRTTNDQGVASMKINLIPGTYILTATNPLSGEQHTTNVTVLPSIVENHDLTMYYKNGTRYQVKILGEDGKAVGAGVKVRFNINGVFYDRTTDTNGYAGLNINLIPETYTITAEYNGLRASNTIKVLPVLQTKDLKMSYKDGSKFEAKVLDGQGKPYAGQTVTFNINGVFYQRTTGDDGVARLSINLMAGQYIITSTYNGLNAANKVTISG